MNFSSHTWHLLARSLNGEATPAEQEEFLSLLQQDELLQQQYELLKRIWKERDSRTEDDRQTANKIKNIINRAEEEQYQYDQQLRQTRRLRRRRRLFAACAIVVLLLAGSWIWMGKGASPVAEAKSPEPLVAKNGSRIRSLLSDGTIVWLNAGSKLEYINDFAGATREVKLEGEAFFDVVKQVNRPFIVHTGDIDIKVLGTTFNVKSYPEDETVETTLYKGMVKVFRSKETELKAIQLKPNQKLVLARQAANETTKLSADIRTSSKTIEPAFILTPIDSTKKENERFETAWLYSRLEFRGDDFEELARKLERWYNVKILFTDEAVKRLNVDGSFEKETVAEAFAALKAGFPNLHYKINNDEISVGLSE